jgi:hypothetical protein
MKVALIKFNITAFFLHPIRKRKKETLIIEPFSFLLFCGTDCLAQRFIRRKALERKESVTKWTLKLINYGYSLPFSRGDSLFSNVPL